MNLAYGQGGLKLEINIPPQHISAKSKGGLIIEGGVSSSEYGNLPITEPWTICTLPKLSCIVRDFKSDPDCSMWMYMYSHYQMIGNQIWLPLLDA